MRTSSSRQPPRKSFETKRELEVSLSSPLWDSIISLKIIWILLGSWTWFEASFGVRSGFSTSKSLLTMGKENSDEFLALSEVDSSKISSRWVSILGIPASFLSKARLSSTWSKPLWIVIKRERISFKSKGNFGHCWEMNQRSGIHWFFFQPLLLF